MKAARDLALLGGALGLAGGWIAAALFRRDHMAAGVGVLLVSIGLMQLAIWAARRAGP